MSELLTRDQLVDVLGERILRDADTLRQFIPNHDAIFTFYWAGEMFTVTLRKVVECD